MAVESEILDGVVTNSEDTEYIQSFAVNRDGFLEAPERSVVDRARLSTIAGFAVTGWQFGDESVADRVISVTKFEELPETVKTLRHQGRGVGQRLYNTWQAFAGTGENYGHIGLYTVQLDLSNLADKTGQSVPTIGLRRIALMLREKFQEVDQIVASVHKDLGPVDAALYDQTPSGKKLQKERGVSGVPGVKEKFLIIRRPKTLEKRGEHRRE